MDRRKFLVGLGSLAAGGAAASGTGAFTAASMDRESSINVVNDGDALVGLEVGNGFGAGQRVGKENGELFIDMNEGGGSGVNDDARYQVGAMDDEASGDEIGFTSLYDDDTTPEAAAPGTPLGEDGTQQGAFVVENNSGHDLDIQIGYKLDNADPAGAQIYLQGHATSINTSTNDDNTETDGAVATGSVDFTNGKPADNKALSYQDNNGPGDENISGDESIPPGDAIHVSLQVDTTQGEGEPNLAGSLVVNANKAAEPSAGG